MQFADLKINDKVFTLFQGSTLAEDTIDSISSHNGKITMALKDCKLTVAVEPRESISFDEKHEVVLFTLKHNLLGDKNEYQKRQTGL